MASSGNAPAQTGALNLPGAANASAGPDGKRDDRLARLEGRVAALEAALLRIDPGLIADLERTQPLSVIDPSRAKPLAERLDITHAFAMLDASLLEASRREQEAVAEAADLPIFDGPVPIDPSLIDRAFERPPPEKLDVRCGLETHHEKILRLITITWHTPEALAYLRKLIVDERGNRAGFSPEVMSELLMLAGVLESVGPRDQDAWRANARVI